MIEARMQRGVFYDCIMVIRRAKRFYAIERAREH